MRRRSTRKTMCKNTNRVVTTIETIPREIASEILALVATDSLTDITNVKLSCKVLKEIAEDSYVYRHASLAKFPVVQWKSQTEEEKTFLNKCWECRNPEFLYRKGVVDYFSRNRTESASEYLTTAARLGHVGAVYVISIIFLFGDDEQKQKGITVLSDMKKSRVFRKKVKHCRRFLIEILRMIWIKNSLIINHRPICCTRKDQHAKKQGWPATKIEEEDMSCEACTCDTELAFIFDVLPSTL
ncbi:unnamed protein product [Fraxinus pennsylvanica]|uniref:F-box domain-containing protein n=1 Tax=Fraxinus pennsylvanica TaxID=56036 RepID=A0AAD2DTX3_9LAMI|nr:unnamed protein product [Fraxinus pennsylvanica]